MITKEEQCTSHDRLEEARQRLNELVDKHRLDLLHPEVIRASKLTDDCVLDEMP